MDAVFAQPLAGGLRFRATCRGQRPPGVVFPGSGGFGVGMAEQDQLAHGISIVLDELSRKRLRISHTPRGRQTASVSTSIAYVAFTKGSFENFPIDITKHTAASTDAIPEINTAFRS
jgi:hypothetical protein